MKKLILFIVIFAIISVSLTAGLIYWKNHFTENQQQESVPVISDEKTLDLYGMYNENDLEIKELTMLFGEKEITYPQISGLRNKAVEKKINDTIKSKISNRYQELLNDNTIENLDFYYYRESRNS